MKIGIIGDNHFGAGLSLGKTDQSTQLNTRLLDYAQTFNSVIDEFERRNVKLVVLTGDVFDSRHPSTSVINIFTECLQRAIRKGLKFIMVAGNHDEQRGIGATTLDFYNALDLDNIKAFTDFGVYTINDAGHPFNIILMPYFDRQMLGGGLITNNDANENIRARIAKLTTGLKGKKIVVAHFMIDRTITGETSEIFSISEIVLNLDLFKDFDATFSGHIHFPQVISKKPFVMYTGSMDRIDLREAKHNKISVVFDTNNPSDVEIIKTKTRDMFEISLDLEQSGKSYAHETTEKILEDITKFNIAHHIADAIVKLTIKVKENDMYFVNQDRIKEYVLSKGVNYLMPIQISSMSNRQLRSKDITETVDSKVAMASFIKNLVTETEPFKKKLIKAAEFIIEEVTTRG
jgi:DNA repair exonuclease SbcCD nuclease subunit